MKKLATCVGVVVMTAAVAAGQGRTAEQVLAEAQKALGGDRLAAVRTASAVGRTLRTAPNGTTVENDFEFALELPDKYRMRSVLAAMGSMSVYRNSGFNGNELIDEVDQPPSLSGGHVVIRMGPSGADPEKQTAEQKAEAQAQRLRSNRRDFARLALGLFAGSQPSYPLRFTYVGEAESADGKADVLDVANDDGFTARLFIDQATHLPLMLSWQDKEPLVVQMGGGPGMPPPGGGTTAVFRATGDGHGGPPSKEQLEKMREELEARRQEAEAKRRTVEYRVYYGDYRSVGGVTWPHRIQRSIDGKLTEEMVFDVLKVNPKVDPKQFRVSK